MICPVCKKPVTQNHPTYDSKSGKNIASKYWECPEGHVEIKYQDNKIFEYRLFFERKGKMYKIYSMSDISVTKLLSKVIEKGYHRNPYRQEMSIPHFIEPIIKDDSIQIEQLFDKLKKLVVFS